jgi:UDP-glucose 4-epimerase
VIKFWAWFQLPYAITYFYNVYGDDENEEGEYATLIWIFKKASREKRKLPVVLPGTQKRNFTHINDIVNWLVLVWEKWFWDEFGIWAQENYSVIEVAEMFGWEIEWLPERAGNRMDAKLLNSKIKELWWVQIEKLENYIKNLTL